MLSCTPNYFRDNPAEKVMRAICKEERLLRKYKEIHQNILCRCDNVNDNFYDLFQLSMAKKKILFRSFLVRLVQLKKLLRQSMDVQRTYVPLNMVILTPSSRSPTFLESLVTAQKVVALSSLTLEFDLPTWMFKSWH